MGQNQQEQSTGSVSPLRAVVYVRISDDPESTERGVDRQEADCRAYAVAHGWEVAAVRMTRRRSSSARSRWHRVSGCAAWFAQSSARCSSTWPMDRRK